MTIKIAHFVPDCSLTSSPNVKTKSYNKVMTAATKSKIKQDYLNYKLQCTNR